MDGIHDGTSPRLAATVVLLRDAANGPEVLITVRQKNLRFMPGAAVFPGGALADGDADPRWARLCDLSPERAGELLAAADGALALAHFVAAIRETYEEVGLLLATGGSVPREAARDGVAFVDACSAAGIRLNASELVPAGRWTTPLGAPIRFNAQFFVARAPDDFTPQPDTSEVAGWQWSTPAAALTALGAGEYIMAPPTIEMLHRLDGHESVDEVMRSLASRPSDDRNVISTRLSPTVHVVIAPNAGLMTGPGTNTYIVGRGPTCVIDPAVSDAAYLDAVQRAAGEIATIAVTHRHPDHTGGVAALRAASGASVRAWGAAPIDGEAVDALSDGETISMPGIELTAIYSPGHASDHVCFYSADSASLFAGDNILGEGTAVIAPPDGSMRDYLATLHRLRALHVDRIYPGHFRALDGGRAIIDRYISHRAERENAIVDALRDGPLTVDGIVAAVYVDTPPALHPIARYSVLAHLEMLQEDGQVSANGDFWSPSDV